MDKNWHRKGVSIMQLKCPLMNIGIAVSMAVCGMCLYAKTSSANGTVAKVVEKSDAVAQFRYAEMLRDGRGMAKNVREAVTWTRRAADGGLAATQGHAAAKAKLQELGINIPHSQTNVETLNHRKWVAFISNSL